MSKKRARDRRGSTEHPAPAPAPVVTHDPPARSRGRAGRNLVAATGVGLGLAALVLVSAYFVKVAFVGLACVAILLAIWELANALAVRDIRPPLAPLAVGAVGMLVSAYAGGTEALVAAFALTVLAVLLWRLSDGPEAYLRDTTAGVFTAVYIPFLASFAVLMLVPDDGAERVTLFMLVTVCSDLGGYAVGVLIGRHPMAPRISPKKTWEGLTGSVLACAAGGAYAVMYLFDEPWWKGLIIGLGAVCSATLGDLGESLIKRDLGIKDMSTLLPGHGGIMDRLDSLLITAPVVWLLLILLIPPVL